MIGEATGRRQRSLHCNPEEQAMIRARAEAAGKPVYWGVVGRNAERRGLSKARYLVGLVKRDASEEEDRGPYMALAPEEQRELLEAVREVRALMLEEPPAKEPDTAAASREASPQVNAAEPGRPVPSQGRLL